MRATDLLPLAAALALAACAAQPGPRASSGQLRADPSKIVAAELAFARLAQERGQWTAFARTSTGDAVMFVPQAVNAHQWLRGRDNPAAAVKWQPHQVWASCDGSLAVTKGAWQRPDGAVGYFTTVWQRQGDGEYKWVLDQGDQLAQPLAEPEMIGGKVAECPGREEQPSWMMRAPRAAIRPMACNGAECQGGGSSADGTLMYDFATTAEGRRLTVQLRHDGALQEVLRSDVKAS